MELFALYFNLLFYVELSVGFWITIFTQPLRSGRIWHKVNFLTGV